METLYAATVESLEVRVRASADPTGTAPGFCLTAPDAVTPGAFTAGDWDGTWSAGAWVTAITPTIGSDGTLTVTSGSTYKVWIQVTAGSETAVWPVGELRIP